MEIRNIAVPAAGAFTSAYRLAIEGCDTYRKAPGEPFLRPQIPTTPGVLSLNLDPEPKWPECPHRKEW